MFKVAVYTDVSAAEAVDGHPGFNFLAITPGMTGSELQVIREQLLHQHSVFWSAQADPLDHPQSMVFVPVGGNFYFGRGKSTGTTINGRAGNTLTEAAVAESAEDLQPYVPAQILAATNWSLERVSGKEIPGWETPLTIPERFELDDLWEKLHNDPWLSRQLPEMFTMLEQALAAHPKKLIIRSSNLDDVLELIAMLTITLSSSIVQQLPFRGFVEDPYRVSDHIVAMHPRLGTCPASGANVIDLDNHTLTAISVSPWGRQIATWISKLNLYEALDVVDLGIRWMEALGVEQGAVATEIVSGIYAGELSQKDEWELGLDLVAALSQRNLQEDLDTYLDEISDAIASFQLHTQTEFVKVADALLYLNSTEISQLTENVLLAALEQLTMHPEFASAFVQELTSNGTWRWPQSVEPAQLIQLWTDIVNGAPAEHLPILLPFVRTLPQQPDVQQLAPSLERAVHLIRSQPQAAQGIEQWFGGEVIAAWIRQQIINHADIYSAEWKQLVNGQYDFLGSGIDVVKAQQYLAQRRGATPIGRGAGGAGSGIQIGADTQTTDWNLVNAEFLDLLLAAQLSRLPVKERITAIQQAAVLPSSGQWPRVFADVQPPEKNELLIAWISRVPPSNDLQNLAYQKLGEVLKQDPSQMSQQEIKVYVRLAEVLHQQLDTSASAEWLKHVEEYRDQVPTRADKFKRAFGRLKRSGGSEK